MVRTTITPGDTNINLSIPQDYVGRKIEVMYYPIDELVEDVQPEPISMAKFRGILSAEEGSALQDYVRRSREEWDRNS